MVWGYFGDGEDSNCGDFLGENPQKTSKNGAGTGEGFSGIFASLVLVGSVWWRLSIGRKVDIPR